MIEFKDLSLDDRELFNESLKAFGPQASELTFTNLFMWRKSYNIRYALLNGYLLIISVPVNKEPFSFIPIGPYLKDTFNETVAGLKEYFAEKGWKMQFKRVEEDRIHCFNGISKEEAALDQDNGDYVYLSSDLTVLSGKKYDGKRNHIKNFKRSYEYEYVKLDKSNTDECIRIVEDWCRQRSCSEHEDFFCERLANIELLNNYETLGCKGGLIKVNGRFEAFTVGEMLNEDTAVIHIEKANTSINGLYTFVNQQFCENEWSGVNFINREQDLGVEGIRKAKLSYKPVKMINKYTVVV
ncbi:MAG TPA: phosphatidylglycerol lysyltransferase domain-containing protein [Clostridia bacterium]